MTQERQVETGLERGENLEGLNINAELLIETNRSSLANERLDAWNHARTRGELTAFDKCSDARIKTPGNNSISVSTIAGAGIPTEMLATDRGIGRWVALTHFSSSTTSPGEMPRGCGGLAAKGNKQSIEGTEIESYVKYQIADKDPFIQSLRTAEKVADISEKPTAAFAMDHLTHEIYPIGYFMKRGKTITKVSSIRDYDIAEYDPEVIYAQGLPTLEDEDLPDDFREIININKEEQQHELEMYPDLRSRQEVQNPRIVLVTTDIRSATVKFPRIAAVPGSMFKVHISRYKLKEEAQIEKDALDMALRQAWYAIHHSVVNNDEPEKPFHGTDTLIIETGSLQLTRNAWDIAKKRGWMRDWINLPEKKVILLQTNAGRINDALEITA